MTVGVVVPEVAAVSGGPLDGWTEVVCPSAGCGFRQAFRFWGDACSVAESHECGPEVVLIPVGDDRLVAVIPCTIDA